MSRFARLTMAVLVGALCAALPFVHGRYGLGHEAGGAHATHAH